jgi:hypothetical protein
MVLLLPEARYQRAFFANPGFYTFPDRQKPYPYGLKNLTVPDETIATSLHRNVMLLLGEADTNANQSLLRHNALTDSQGANRYERGQHFFKALKTFSQRLKAPLNWHLITVPGVGHSEGLMAQAAAQLMQDYPLSR